MHRVQARAWLAPALAEARAGPAEGGIPVGAALHGAEGTLLGRGRTRRAQDGDPSTRVVLLDDPECAGLMRGFVRDHPDLWNEDIGE
ncbi:hypothetical protein [Streptomyces sp. NPDC046197]|uniref:hypothetical protein n=1 Tax=Streptomyces sp. NPDC046197 TaxID=3154337 RepID=UPI0033D38580